jgi:hypothetical protein
MRAALAALVIATGSPVLGGQSGQREAFRAEVTDRETRVVRVPANGLLALTNMVGDIEVRAGRGPDVRVEIVRVARGRTEADARRGLADVTARQSERGSRVAIDAAHQRVRNPPYAVAVSYQVTAPAATGVTISSLTGNIVVSGIDGDLSVETTTGDVEIRDAGSLSRARAGTGRVTLTRVAHASAIEAGTIAGPVVATDIRTRQLRIDTVTGNIDVHGASAARVEVSTTQGHVSYEGTVARDGRYDLRTHSGSLRVIASGGSGFELRAQTFSGRVEVAGDLGLRVISRGRRDLVGSVGDGRAAVNLTTFSGQVSVSRR